MKNSFCLQLQSECAVEQKKKSIVVSTTGHHIIINIKAI